MLFTSDRIFSFESTATASFRVGGFGEGPDAVETQEEESASSMIMNLEKLDFSLFATEAACVVANVLLICQGQVNSRRRRARLCLSRLTLQTHTRWP